MFLTSIQPPTVSLFSSTNTDPLQTFLTHTDALLPADSFIHFLHDQTSLPVPKAPATLISLPTVRSDLEEEGDSGLRLGYTLAQTVLHIQSPTIRTTYIQCPSADTRGGLGLKHHWMHVQVRALDREWALEVGLVDLAGRLGVVRLSTFQKHPRLSHSMKPNAAPILHLPLSFPQASSHPLTAWCTLAVYLPSLLSHFSSPHLGGEDRQASNYVVPSGTYSHISYVRVYATCRLRRIWFGDGGPHHQQAVPWEFELYSDQ